MWKRSIGVGAAAALVILLAFGCKKSPPADTGNVVARIHWLGKKKLASDRTAARLMTIWNMPESVNLEAQTLDKLALAMGNGSEVRGQKSGAVGNSNAPSPYPLTQGEEKSKVQSPKSKVGTENSNAPSPYPPPQGEEKSKVQSPRSKVGTENSNAPSPYPLPQGAEKSKVQSPKSKVGTENSNAPSPYPLPQGEGNRSSALVRTLLQDIVSEESYLEIRHAPGHEEPEIAFAIRLSEDRARVWQTNLPQLSTFNFQPSTPPRINRSGGWTIVGLGKENNALANEMCDRIQKTSAPFEIERTNSWLTVDMDAQQTSDALALGLKLPANAPRISMKVTGDGQNVLTRGELNFSKPLSIEFEPLNIPTNIVRGRLHSFRMLHGIRPWLSSLKGWNDLQIGPPPNQFFWWSVQAYAAMTYVAAPMPDASKAVATISEFLLQNGNPWLVANASGQFARSTIADGLMCTAGNPVIGPFLQSAQNGPGEVVLAGLMRGTATNEFLPATISRELQAKTNLVYFETEGTGAEIQTWLYLGQALRVIFWKAQLPVASASAKWLKIGEQTLGNCSTRVTKTGPSQLTFARASTVGFDSLELHLLCDWLESPRFPHSLHTLSALGVVRPRARNAPPAGVPGNKR